MNYWSFVPSVLHYDRSFRTVIHSRGIDVEPCHVCDYSTSEQEEKEYCFP